MVVTENMIQAEKERQMNRVIETPDELVDRQVKTHWHFQERRYSVSVRASNGRWYVVRDERGDQLFFGKLVLSNATFTVQPAGKRKAYKTGKRNVHASVIGTVKSAEVRRTKAFVPCGTMIAYSHNLYPEPEFKAIGSPQVRSIHHMSMYPGIEWAEMLACGTDPITYKPNMLAAGRLRLTRYA
jgi:hypothetical protein